MITIYQVKQGSNIRFSSLSKDEAEDVQTNIQTSIFAETGVMPEIDIESLERKPVDHSRK